MPNYRRLPLDGLLNARDLGGYPTKNGQTRWGVFLRADVPIQLTPGDRDFLRRFGVTTDIDLRGDTELFKKPDALAEEDWLEYRQIPLRHDPAGEAGRPHAFRADFSWGEQYVVMAETQKDWICRVLEALATARGAALFHCSLGKDRTGVVAAALLGLCGVSDEDIVADFTVSSCYLEPIYLGMLKHVPDGYIQTLDAPHFSAAPENMKMLLRHVNREYGGIPGYVRACGTAADAVRRLVRRLSADGNFT
jgi:protein-tyrosine phosphatase